MNCIDYINKNSVSWWLFLLFAILIYGIISGIIGNIIVFDTIGFIEFVAVLLFILCIVLALKRNKYFWTLLPFIYVAFPSNINNVFPGIYLESQDLKVIYPFFNHVELFLCLSILWYGKGRIKCKIDAISNILIVTFIFSTIFNIFRYHDIHYTCLLIAGMYPVRLLVLTLIMIRIIPINISCFIMGITYSILFLLFESGVNSIIFHYSELKSASLGVNTFGNVLGQLSVLLLFYYVSYGKRKYVFYVSMLAFLGMILTGTRMAMLSSLLVIIFIIYPKLKTSIKFSLVIFTLLVVILFINSGIEVANKFNIKLLLESTNLSGGELDMVRTEATTSLITRLELWKTSLSMLWQNPFTGIGWNLFNVLKYKYGFSINVIIDSHNGYLSFLSQLGIWGFFWIYYLFIRCWKLYKIISYKQIQSLLIFNIGMSICEFSNAGSYKFGILGLLIFIASVSRYCYKNTKVRDKDFGLKDSNLII